jgi:hypothetical protein
MSTKEIVASSKTYRKATGMVADALGIDADYSGTPSRDFKKIVRQIQATPEIDESQLSAIAEKYYRIGMRGGLRLATDLMAQGHFFIKGNKCYAEGNTTFERRLRMPDGERAQFEFDFSPDDLGFTD